MVLTNFLVHIVWYAVDDNWYQVTPVMNRYLQLGSHKTRNISYCNHYFIIVIILSFMHIYNVLIMLSSYQLYQYSQRSQFNSTARHFINHYFTMSICTVAVYYTLKYYMHGSLFLSKKNCAAQCFGMLYARQSVIL